MPSDETSAGILQRYREGDERAADELFSRYVGRLTLLARSRLSPALARRTDPEDVVLSAYRSFFIRARDGRLTPARSGDLWRLLVAITLHKLYRQARKQRAERRALAAREFESSWAKRLQLSRDPSPAEAVALADELQAIFRQLDPFARRVLELRLQDRSPAEIAVEVGRSERTIRRTVALIRERLLSQHPDSRRQLERIRRELREATTDARKASKPREVPKRGPRRSAQAPDSSSPLSYRDYVLEEMIGAGRFGKVYRARQRSLGRTVAIKYLRKSFQEDRHTVARFIDEARIVAQLQHPGIVPVHGVGQTPAGGYFIAMDFIDGSDLSRRATERSVPVADAVRWTMQACTALGHAHDRGIIHCDLKPANLLLDAHGCVRVTDFGLARSRDTDTQSIDRIEGTCGSMAPEQVSGWWGPIDLRTDVYGLGAVLFHLLTGRPPFQGASLADTLAQVVSGISVPAPVRLRPDISPSLNEVCLRCLSKSPETRYETMRQLGEALEEALSTLH
jgi:eukaryotic-like serine/threonine-protein kinase